MLILYRIASAVLTRTPHLPHPLWQFRPGALLGRALDQLRCWGWDANAADTAADGSIVGRHWVGGRDERGSLLPGARNVVFYRPWSGVA